MCAYDCAYNQGCQIRRKSANWATFVSWPFAPLNPKSPNCCVTASVPVPTPRMSDSMLCGLSYYWATNKEWMGEFSPVFGAMTSEISATLHTAQRSSDNLLSYPPDDHYRSNNVYWRLREKMMMMIMKTRMMMMTTTTMCTKPWHLKIIYNIIYITSVRHYIMTHMIATQGRHKSDDKKQRYFTEQKYCTSQQRTLNTDDWHNRSTSHVTQTKLCTSD